MLTIMLIAMCLFAASDGFPINDHVDPMDAVDVIHSDIRFGSFQPSYDQRTELYKEVRSKLLVPLGKWLRIRNTHKRISEENENFAQQFNVMLPELITTDFERLKETVTKYSDQLDIIGDGLSANLAMRKILAAEQKSVKKDVASIFKKYRSKEQKIDELETIVHFWSLDNNLRFHNQDRR